MEIFDIVDEKGTVHGTSPSPISEDLYCELLSTRLVVLPLAYVYKASSIKHLRWDIGLSLSEDTDWLHQVARDREQDWLYFDEPVGVWYQHSSSARLTSAYNNNLGMVVRAESVLATYQILASNSRIDHKRRAAAAFGLWKSAHLAFYLSPIYWSKIVRQSIAMDKNVLSHAPIYQKASRFRIDPLLIDWLMIPKRYLNHYLYPLIKRLRGTDHIRRF